jgi:hypothetical protein
MEPTVDGTPSVQMPTQFCQDRLLFSDMKKDIKYILPFACLGQLFVREKAFLNFTTYVQLLLVKCIDLSTWIEKLLFFSCHAESVHCHLTCHKKA